MGQWEDMENWARQNVGQPVQQAVGQGSAPAQNTDAGAQAMKMAALSAISANPQAVAQGLPPDQIAMQKAMAAKMSAQPGMDLPDHDDPSMSPENAQLKQASLAQAPEQMAAAAAKLRQQAALDQAHEAMMNQPIDTAGYQDVPTTAQKQANRFQGLQDKIQNQKTITKQDIHKAIAPHAPIEMSDDPEEAERQIAAARGE